MKIQRILSVTWFIHTLMIIMVGFSLLLESQASPTGENSKIAFSKLFGDKFKIVVTDEYGKNIQILSRNHKDDYEPSWSFDGRHIAFTSDRNGNGFDIYIMNADSSNEYQVTKNEVWEYSPSFSPDGKKLVFTRIKSLIQLDPKIYTIDIDGSNERYIAGGYTPKWSPDGEKIVFWKDRNIYIIDIDGKNQVKITDGYYPSWSPDGKYIAFTSSRDNSGNQIHKMDSDGKNIVCLTVGMTNAVNPSWSPDGEHIVFWDMATYNIYKVSADGGTSMLISDGMCMYPSWFDPDFYSVNPAGKLSDTWGGLKRR